VEAVPKVIFGNPDKDFICTSHVERQTLTIRIHSTLKITPAMAAGITDHAWHWGIDYGKGLTSVLKVDK
jgi:hypothetical protein